ncbi:ATP-dependent zinc metalloprotease FtsH [Patulibacter brassicae]|jgi:cell division protease FtsH|uniref:ATP-dependent zinc metalloprotease FtsH n=1 Tax=Patulibacter brassicae TaxID=1705717 RepID=A0ABU4VMJ5_9ACTN|nr:ATP-dependent zinc metalloprotease FtsH [Patulibacter brassicae]MDX8153067.1 ATP-dependent zinc metalloprotease FtsH [Patulibacter brassicae]
MNRFFKSALFPILIVLLLAFFAQRVITSESTVKATFNEFQSQLDNGELKNVVVQTKDNSLKVTLKSDKTYEVGYIPAFGPQLEGMLQQAASDRKLANYDVKSSRTSGLWQILAYTIPFILFIGLWFLIMNQVQGGGSKVMSFGKSRAKKMSVDAPKITFRDVAGADEAVEELHEIKEFLENPKKFQALGARIPKGVLLFGPPGTGKTLLARAVAGEAGVPFFSISGSDFVEMFVGVGASRVRDLFEQAKQNSPCIIFMDEIDAVGRHRGAGMGGGHDEREQTLNQLLVEMDGFTMTDNIILIAATNRPDILDPALLRPGRFDRQIVVDRPDRKGRAKILEVHTRGKPLAGDIEVEALAGQTPGFTGADLANLVNEAALLAARTGKKQITQHELEEGIMRVIAGPEKKTRVMTEKEREITAYHEMGHAFVGHFLEHADPVHKISVVGRGQALGYTISMPSEDKFLTTRAQLLDQMAMTLGGRAAEEIVFGEITTGASNDLEKVTSSAKQMVMRFGMSERLGPRVFGHNHGQPFLGRDMASEPDYSDEIAREIDDEIRRIVESAHQRATDLLNEHREALNRISEILIRRETIERDEFLALLDGRDEDDVFHDDPPSLPPGAPSTADEERSERPAPRPLPRPGLGTAMDAGDGPQRPRRI